MIVRQERVPVPDGVHHAIAAVAAVLAAIGVHQAIRVLPIKVIEIRIAGLHKAEPERWSIDPTP